MNTTDQQPNTQTSTIEENFAPNVAVEQQITSQKGKKWDKILNVLLALVVAVLLCTVVVKAFFVSNVVISGDSMLETYTDGQIVNVDRTANQNTVARGDVVVFYVNVPNWFAEHFGTFFGANSDQHKLLIKRVVALAGDKIWIEQIDGENYVMIQTPSGEILTENAYTLQGESLPHKNFAIPTSVLLALANTTQETPYVVAENTFFAMGDNRKESHDSRYADIGNVPYANLFGKVMD